MKNYNFQDKFKDKQGNNGLRSEILDLVSGMRMGWIRDVMSRLIEFGKELWKGILGDKSDLR